MTTRIQKWGNSLALRIPRSFAKDIRLSQGSEVDLTVDRGRLMIVPSRKAKYPLAALLKGINKKNLHHEVDTGTVSGNEAW